MRSTESRENHTGMRETMAGTHGKEMTIIERNTDENKIGEQDNRDNQTITKCTST